MSRANGAAFNGGDLSSNNPACTYNGSPVRCGVVIHPQALVLQGMPDTQYPHPLLDRQILRTNGARAASHPRRLARNRHGGDYSREASSNRIGIDTWT
jgi:hypothetical protein